MLDRTDEDRQFDAEMEELSRQLSDPSFQVSEELVARIVSSIEETKREEEARFGWGSTLPLAALVGGMFGLSAGVTVTPWIAVVMTATAITYGGVLRSLLTRVGHFPT